MKLRLDENFDVRLVPELRKEGFDVDTVTAEGRVLAGAMNLDAILNLRHLPRTSRRDATVHLREIAKRSRPVVREGMQESDDPILESLSKRISKIGRRSRQAPQSIGVK